MTTKFARDRVAIVGVGYSDVRRHSEHTVGHLAVQACTKALDDAGLGPENIDGISTYSTPGGPPTGQTRGCPTRLAARSSRLSPGK